MPALKLHCLQHEDFEGVGCISDWASDRGHQLTYTEFFKGDDLPDIQYPDFLIIMGGSMSVNDEKEYSWLRKEKEFIREVIDAGKPVLGICLGAQLISCALGKQVYKNSSKEIGWWPVRLTEAGRSQAFFDSLPQEFNIFQWHGDTFDLPEGAVLLAESPGCRNQAFIYGGRTLALQFHLEVTLHSMEVLLKSGTEELLPDVYVQSAEQVRRGASHIAFNNGLMYCVLDYLASGQQG